MKLLEEKIKKDGEIIDGIVLKVDSFLNHQLDINLFNEMGYNQDIHYRDIRNSHRFACSVPF